jgi:hypothetical protein
MQVDPQHFDVRVHVASYLQLDARLARLTELVQDLHDELASQKAQNAALRLDARDHVCRAELHAAMVGKAASSDVNQLKIRVNELYDSPNLDPARAPASHRATRAPSITVGSARAQPSARRNAVTQLSEQQNSAVLLLTLRREMSAANEAQAQMAKQLQTVLDLVSHHTGSTHVSSLTGAAAQLPADRESSHKRELKSGVLNVSEIDSSVATDAATDALTQVRQDTVQMLNLSTSSAEQSFDAQGSELTLVRHQPTAEPTSETSVSASAHLASSDNNSNALRTVPYASVTQGNAFEVDNNKDFNGSSSCNALNSASVVTVTAAGDSMLYAGSSSVLYDGSSSVLEAGATAENSVIAVASADCSTSSTEPLLTQQLQMHDARLRVSEQQCSDNQVG